MATFAAGNALPVIVPVVRINPQLCLNLGNAALSIGLVDVTIVKFVSGFGLGAVQLLIPISAPTTRQIDNVIAMFGDLIAVLEQNFRTIPRIAFVASDAGGGGRRPDV